MEALTLLEKWAEPEYNSRMRFTKMHGLGNDYVYVNTFDRRVTDPARLAIAVSNRHTGIGSDGLILIGPSRVADARMEMYNADGSRGRMCGNGIRCVAKYVVEHGLARGSNVTIETDAGVKQAQCELVDGRVVSVRIDMGVPSLHPQSLPSTIPVDRVVDYPYRMDGEVYRITCVSMGNPHAVIFVDDVADFDLPSVGPKFEFAPEFPERINLHVVQVNSREHAAMRTWERGSGMTQACGTGACAVGVACVLNDRTSRKLRVTLPGGDLLIEWASDDHVYMTGPAVEVFSGDWPE